MAETLKLIMSPKKPFSKNIILIDNIEAVVSGIIQRLQQKIYNDFKRLGAVVGISGGLDSSVCLALTTRAIGNKNVLGILMPEKNSSPESEVLAKELANKFGVKSITENITPPLEGFGCYQKRDEAVRRIFPEYNPENHKMKIRIKQSPLSNNLPPVFFLTIIDNKGNQNDRILPLKEYLQIVAATNFKQRTRMTTLYYHAELNHYAVIGTPNKHEYQQGFFVKHGDGAADIMPIVNLYKTQVYQIAEYLGVPKGIIDRIPTTDTYSAEQTQEEFFFQLPYDLMDIYWFGFENDYSPAEVSKVMGESEERVEALFNNFKRKKQTTEYLRMGPIFDY